MLARVFSVFPLKTAKSERVFESFRESFLAKPQIGPKPMQLVVVIAVRAAVIAATMTFRISSQMFLFFMAF